MHVGVAVVPAQAIHELRKNVREATARSEDAAPQNIDLTEVMQVGIGKGLGKGSGFGLRSYFWPRVSESLAWASLNFMLGRAVQRACRRRAAPTTFH